MQLEIIELKCRVQVSAEEVVRLNRLTPKVLTSQLRTSGAGEMYLEGNEEGGGYFNFTASTVEAAQRIATKLEGILQGEPESTGASAPLAKEPWEIGEKAVRERLPNAVVFYSFSELPDKQAVSGKAVFISKHDAFYGDGCDFRSAVVENPTYLDVALLADQAILTTGDRHHSFIEAFRHSHDEGPVQVFTLHFGS